MSIQGTVKAILPSTSHDSAYCQWVHSWRIMFCLFIGIKKRITKIMEAISSFPISPNLNVGKGHFYSNILLF